MKYETNLKNTGNNKNSITANFLKDVEENDDMINDKAMDEEDEGELDDAVNIDPGIYMENVKSSSISISYLIIIIMLFKITFLNAYIQ